MRFTRISLIVLALMMFVGVSAVAAQSSDSGSLSGTEWRLVSFGTAGLETLVMPDDPITLEFTAENGVTGLGGCESYSGTYTVNLEAITFAEVGATDCAPEEISEQDQAFFDALNNANTYALANTELTIWYNNNEQRLIFVSNAPEDVGLQNTVWHLEGYGEAEVETPVVPIPSGNISLVFGNGGQVEGNTGCNSFSGSFFTSVAASTATDDTDTAGDTDTETDTDTEGDTDTETDTDTEGDTETDTDTDTESDTDTEGDTDADVIVDVSDAQNTISFGDLVSTLVACTDEALGNQETAYLNALRSAVSYERLGNRLVIWYDPAAVVDTTTTDATAEPTAEGDTGADAPQRLLFVYVGQADEMDDTGEESSEDVETTETGLPAGCTNPWVVAAGDTLEAIAVTCETTVDAILAANPDITDASVISVGQEIVIPTSGDDGS